SERHVARREDGGHGFPSKAREVEYCDRYESEDEGLWRKTNPADITHELINENAMIALNRARDRQIDREVRHEVGGDGETDKHHRSHQDVGLEDGSSEVPLMRRCDDLLRGLGLDRRLRHSPPGKVGVLDTPLAFPVPDATLVTAIQSAEMLCIPCLLGPF